MHFKRQNFRSHFIFYFLWKEGESNVLFVTCYHKIIYLKNIFVNCQIIYINLIKNNSVDGLKCNQNLERIPNIFELLQVS